MTVLHPQRLPRQGFSWVEVLLVLIVMTLLAVFGFNQLARARMAASEQLALNSLRAMAKACQLFVPSNQQYPMSLAELGAPASNPPLLDSTLIGDGTTVFKQGYQFTYRRPATGQFIIHANPKVHGETGAQHFLIDQTMSLYGTTQNRDATTSDTLVP